MERKYHVANMGIGDLIFFCGEIISTHGKGDTIEIYLSRDILNTYRGEQAHQYGLFCMEYIRYFLSDYKVAFLSDKDQPNCNIELSPTLYQKILSNDEAVGAIKRKLGSSSSDLEDHVVVFTKVRALHVDVYNSISGHFFDYLNGLDKKIILLGERSVEYGYEYAQHGKNLIYTIYDDCVSRIHGDFVVDLTSPAYQQFNLNGILNDVGIISKSNQTFVFGGGGFFCLSLFTEKLVSLVGGGVGRFFHTRNNTNIFDDASQFLEFTSVP